MFFGQNDWLLGKSFSVDELYDRFYNELVLWIDAILKDMFLILLCCWCLFITKMAVNV